MCTGVNQTAGKLQLERMDQMAEQGFGNFVEVSAHTGARSAGSTMQVTTGAVGISPANTKRSPEHIHPGDLRYSLSSAYSSPNIRSYCSSQ